MAREAGFNFDGMPYTVRGNHAQLAHLEALVRADERKQALAAQPAVQPVGYVAEIGVVDWNVCAPPILTDLYTTPPAAKRQWVGLTDDAKLDLISDAKGIGGRVRSDAQLLVLLDMQEAKLKEKNNG